MPCNVTYSCIKRFASLCHHNVIINGEKWHKLENTNSPMTEEEVINEIKNFNCDNEQLIIFDYSKGWVHECD